MVRLAEWQTVWKGLWFHGYRPQHGGSIAYGTEFDDSRGGAKLTGAFTQMGFGRIQCDIAGGKKGLRDACEEGGGFMCVAKGRAVDRDMSLIARLDPVERFCGVLTERFGWFAHFCTSFAMGVTSLWCGGP